MAESLANPTTDIVQAPEQAAAAPAQAAKQPTVGYSAPSPAHGVAPIQKHGAVATALVCVALALAALDGSSSASGSPDGLAATTAHTLNVADTAHLHDVKSAGSALLEEGTATGGLPGPVKVEFVVGATVSASFTIYARSGSIAGHGTGTLHSSGVYASFGGTMTVTHGTGRYAHARGHGGFYGVMNRNTYALTVQTTGKLSY